MYIRVKRLYNNCINGKNFNHILINDIWGINPNTLFV